ncbi:Holliday junction branch migration protein RuvA [Candidatus Dependentiae bacterium]|nr:Holliday junction branch migration protein RuvA [Candidatus Dependentiae bacterium]
MINHISGTITAITQDSIILTSGPIGFSLYVANSAFFKINQKITIQVYMYWHQENGPSFFGFTKPAERHLFVLIISCSGIGPRIALSILSHMSPSEFVEAIQTANERALSAVNGIGTKKAEHIIVQLKHKISQLIEEGVDLGAQGESVQQRNQLVDVLKSLNYSRSEINNTLTHLNEQYNDPTLPFDKLMRHALAFLAKKL